MANLAEIIEERRRANGAKMPMPAGRIETLKPEAYLEEAEGKPTTPIVVGLRTPNDEDYAAALQAEDDTGIMLAIVCRGLCDPNDCRNRHPSFPFPDINIPKMLKPQTIRYLFDRIELLHLETSPTVPLADEAELFILGEALLAGERLERLTESNAPAAARVRRLASVLIQSLGLFDE